MNMINRGLITEQIVSNILETSFKSFTRENIEDAKNRMIDVVGCAIGGARASGNSILLDAVKEWGGKEEATIWISGEKVPTQNAALVNCVMCRSYDYEVTGLGGHSPGTVDVTALTLGGQIGASGKHVLTAAILGGDLAVRLYKAQGFDPKHDFDPAGTINGLATTAMAARLSGLDKQQMLDAFGIVVNLLAGSFQCITDGVECFKLHMGVSSRNALFSVELAKRGFTGVKDALLSPQGYFPQYCRDFHADFLTADLGKIYHTRGVHKMYPSCFGNHGAIECGLEIIRQANINVNDIFEIIVGVCQESYEGHLNQTFQSSDPLQRALFSLPYAISNVLFRKSIRLEHYTEEFIRSTGIADLAKKVRVVRMKPPEQFGAAELKVIMNNGKELSARVNQPWGSIGKLATREDIKDKFLENVEFSNTLSPKRAKQALTMLENLELVDDVGKIIKLLCRFSN
jgi:2-methylcitrate dehydratase PrpD